MIVYVRRIDRHLSSWVQHQIGRGFTIEEAVRDTRIVRYRDRIGRLFEVFGRDAVDVRLCPEIDADGFDALLSDFTNAIGIAFRWPRTGRISRNTAMSQAACEVLDQAYREASDPKRIRVARAVLSQLAQSLPGPSFRLPADTIRGIVGAHRDDIDWLSRQTGIVLDLPKDLDAPGDTAAYADRMARLVNQVARALTAADGQPP